MIRSNDPSAEYPEPRVSVVMPVSNGERFIDEAIQSILGQTLKELELIIVVNGSTDRTLEIACRYAAADPRVRILHREKGSIPLALNAGIAAARAPWIARMDADDVSLPQRLERQLQTVAHNPRIAALGTHGWRIGPTGQRVSEFCVGPITEEEFRYLRNTSLIYMLSSSVMFSRDVALRLGGFSIAYPSGGDIEFWTRIADDHVVLTIPEKLVLYRIHDDSISTRTLQQQERNARRAKTNMFRRRAGEPELSADEFASLEESRPIRQRILTGMESLSQLYYRRGGALLSAGKPIGFAWLMGSLLLYPPLPLARVRQQAVLPVIVGRFRDRRDM